MSPTTAGGLAGIARTFCLASTLVLASCAAGASGVDSSVPPGNVDPDWGPLAVTPGGAGGDGALIQGTLLVSDGCVLLSEQGDRVLLVWPADRTEWVAESETIRFRSAAGEIVTLGDGDPVVLGGGGSSVTEDGQTAEDFVALQEWVSAPAPDCVMGTRWFVYDIVS